MADIDAQQVVVAADEDDLADCTPEERASILADRARKQAFYQEHVAEYEAGTLTKEQVGELPDDKLEAYLKKALERKYNKEGQISFSCNHCATVALFNDPSPDGPYITDDELIEELGFEHM